MKQTIEGIRRKAVEAFLNPYSFAFRKEVATENKLTQQYKARELFELLQNIDDAYYTGCPNPCVAEFRLNGRWLEVSNFGKAFTPDSIIRICEGGVSSKQGPFIGCKGIGFRSVLNWADVVEIYSGSNPDYISVRFSEEFAQEQLTEIQSNDHILQQIRELKERNIPPRYPILKAPDFIPSIEKRFDTLIRLHIKDEATLQRIGNDIANFDSAVIMFMPNIREIRFIDANGTAKIISKKVDKPQSLITIHDSTARDAAQTFFYSECEAKLQKEYNGAQTMKLAVALPLSQTSEPVYPLYSFFPINDQKSPFPALLHATFCLTDNRNALDISTDEVRQVNRAVYSELLKLYVETVCQHETGQNRIEKLMPLGFSSNYEFPGNLANLKCEETFKDYCADKPVLFTVSGQYAGKADQPLFIAGVPAHFNNENFGRIVNLSGNLLSFARWICDCRANENINECEKYLMSAINCESTSWTANTRIETFKWWNSHSEFTSLPRLLKNSNEEFITSQTDACFLSGGMPKPPTWAKITNLSETDEKVLLSAYQSELDAEKDNKKRELAKLISKQLINLQEQSSRQAMISPVNTSINGDFEKAVDFVRWLMKCWSKEPFNATILSEISFNIPAADGTVMKASNLYFGSEYGNAFGREIFDKIAGYAPVASPEQLGLPVDELKDMLSAIGVLTMPKTEPMALNAESAQSDLMKAYIDRLQIPKTVGQVSSYNASLQSIKNIDKLLAKLPTETILKWLCHDSKLVENKYEPDDSFVDYKPYIQGQKYYKRYLSGSNLDSFIRFIISTSSWIEISGKRYRPDEVILTNDEFLPEIGWPTLNDTQIRELAEKVGCDRRKLRLLLKASGVNESVIALSANNFYEILLTVPHSSNPEQKIKSQKFSRNLYKEIIKNGRSDDGLTDFYADSANKRQFFKQGKVLATNRSGDTSYRPISQVYFANSAVLNLSHDYFIDIPPRSGQRETFKEIFNLRSYSLNYSVKKWKPAKSDVDFQNDFKEFLPYPMSFRLDDIEEVCTLSIQLVSEITIESGNKIDSNFEPYTLFEKSRSQWFIKVDDSDYLNLDKSRIAEQLVNIFNVFFNFPKRDFLEKVSHYFLVDKSTRNTFIRVAHGSLDEYEEAIARLHGQHQCPDQPAPQVPKPDLIYSRNLHKLQAIAQNYPEDTLADFLNIKQNDALLHSDNFQLIEQCFKQFVNKSTEQKQPESEPETSLEDFLANSSIVQKVTKGTIPTSSSGGGGSTFSSSKQIETNRRNRRQGDIAEYIVINKLIDRAIPEVVEFLGEQYSIFWISGAATRMKLSDEVSNQCDRSKRNDGAGYDIEVVSADGSRRLYLEVKSSSSAECAFILSYNEYTVAEKLSLNSKAERYRIVFVSNLNIHDPNSPTSVGYLDHDLTSPAFAHRPKDHYFAFAPKESGRLGVVRLEKNV